MDKLLTVKEVSEMLNVSREHVKSLIAWGKLPAINISPYRNKHYRIKETDYQKFLQDCTVPAYRF